MSDKKTLSDLVKELGTNRLSYVQLLQTREWEERRNSILLRDRFQCQLCQLHRSDGISSEGKPFTLLENEVEFKLPDGDIISTTEMSLLEQERFVILQVHHKYYYRNRSPWDYNDEALITVCRECHEQLHKREMVFMYDDEGDRLQLTPCSRCGGTGTLEQFHYHFGGVCFRCNGAKYVELIED